MGAIVSRPNVAIRYFGRDRIPDSSGWLGLPLELESLGLHVREPNDHASATHLIIIDYVPSDEINWPLVPKSRRFLIATEPKIVNPIQFSNRVMKKFNRVIVPSALYPSGENVIEWEGGYYLPTRNNSAVFDNDGLRSNCAIVNENKFSFVVGSNYALRSAVIRKLTNSDVKITIAGKNWTRGFVWTSVKMAHHFVIALCAKRLHVNLGDVLSVLGLSIAKRRVSRHCIGVVKDTVEFLSGFKVSIVIENESSAVSEKVYAALMAGCQCVYVGPPLDPTHFPPGFLYPSGPSVTEVLSQVELALRSSYSITKNCLKDYLRESEFIAQQGVDRRNSWVAKSIAGWIRTDSSI